MTRCGLSANEKVSRLKFFRGWPSLYSWHFAVGSLRTLIFICSLWYKARWKNPEYQLDVNNLYIHVSLTLIFEIAGQMVKCLRHCWSLCWKPRHFYSSSRTWPLEWSRYGENTVYSHSESSSEAGAAERRVKSYNGGEKSHLRWLDPLFLGGYHPTLKLSGIPTFTFIVSLTHRMDNI